ncbi:MAG TPA: hypothetical protein VGP72_33900 [Planctomycetota bacterium]|jgi:hypothetical protein
MRTVNCFVLVLAIACSFVAAEDRIVAAAMAQAAAKLAGDGKSEKARDICFKALANDENCPEALYELGKIYEKDGSLVAAADFFVRASRELARQEAATPAFASKRSDADARIKRLNPYAARLSSLMTDYAQELAAATKKSSDSFTMESVTDRVTSLNLADYVPPEKMPPTHKPEPKATASTPKRSVDDEDGPVPYRRTPKKEVVNNVPLDVERALKADGWDKITGTWKKVKEKGYEVADGKLEATKTSGAMQVIVGKGAGKVKVMVRNTKDSEYSSSYYGTGFGFLVDGGNAKMYTPTNSYFSSSTNAYRPSLERSISLTGDKCQIVIQIIEGASGASALEMTVNGKREHRSNYKLQKEGSFVIEVDGSATIEVPMAKGN